jgi:hypothetical protein
MLSEATSKSGKLHSTRFSCCCCCCFLLHRGNFLKLERCLTSEMQQGNSWMTGCLKKEEILEIEH